MRTRRGHRGQDGERGGDKFTPSYLNQEHLHLCHCLGPSGQWHPRLPHILKLLVPFSLQVTGKFSRQLARGRAPVLTRALPPRSTVFDDLQLDDVSVKPFLPGLVSPVSILGAHSTGPMVPSLTLTLTFSAILCTTKSARMSSWHRLRKMCSTRRGDREETRQMASKRSTGSPEANTGQ